MDISKILNKEQMQAVLQTEGPVIVSAGAGSGKTRLLTYRVAYLITECGVAPYNILAITFTNKAANEMKERIAKVTDYGYMVTVCTFHSLCAKLLRQYSSFLPDYNSNYTVYDTEEQDKIYSKIFKSMEIDKNDTEAKDIKHHISLVKFNYVDIDKYCELNSHLDCVDNLKRVYESYQKELVRNNAMDFDDLLINFYKLLKNNEEVRLSIQNKFKYIHVDEFQDTNALQYEIVRLIAEQHKNILIVGDEDQSIYSWRGANIGNLMKFKQDFPNYKIFKLQQNYRSTKAIIEKANKLIKNNNSRIDKNLFTENEDGDSVELYSGYEESDEADFVVRQIALKHKLGTPYSEMAILMRLNALTRPFEEKLLAYNIPHKIYNGFKFYDRAEIKSTLSYLFAVSNPNDNNNVERLINFPKRGIGQTSITQLNEMAIMKKCSLKDIIINNRIYDLKPSLKKKLEPLADILINIDKKSKESGLYDLICYIVEEAGILDSFDKKDKTEYDRWLNVNSLIKSIQDYETANPEANFTEYLESISLMSQIDEDNQDGVSIATVHSAKGLEFDVVFIVGLEDKIFPISRDDSDIEEERRLMYVAITRAKKKLFLTNAKSRFMYGRREPSMPSKFLKEIDMLKDKVYDYTSPYGEYANNYYSGGGYSNGYTKSGYKSYTGGYGSNTNKDSNSYSSNQYTSGSYYKNTSSNINSNDKIDISAIKGISKGMPKKNLDAEKIKVGAKVSHPKFGEGTIVDMSDFANNSCVSIEFDLFGKKALSLDYAPITFIED